MKKTQLPALVGVLAAAGFVLRKLVYAGAVDEKDLLITGHPLVIALLVLTAAALVLIAAAAWKLDGSEMFEDNFSASAAAFLGHGMAAAGVLCTVLLNAPMMSGLLGTAWKLLGWLTPVCLFLAGYQRLQGKRPFFGLHAIPCLFFAVHVVNHYQVWCSNPQVLDYVFALFGAVALSLFGYHQAAFDVDAGKRRMLLGTGLAAVYLCAAELALTAYPYLYFGGLLWAMTGLCSLRPVPKKPEIKE